MQSLGFPGVGIRLPVMMGVTFASVGPMLSMAASPEIGLLGIYGAVIGAGIFGVLAAPFISRLLPLFPPVVTGTIILVIGVSLMRVGINWAGGGLQTFTRIVDGTPAAVPNPAFGQLTGPGHRAVRPGRDPVADQMGTRLRRQRGGTAGIVAGAVVAAALGLMHFEKVGTAAWFDIVLPFHFGMPQFHLIPIVTMCIVMVVVMIEFAGHVPGAERNHRQTDRPGRPDPRPARRWRRNDPRRHLQYISLYLVLAECRTGRRDRCPVALDHRHRRRHHADPGLLPKMAALVEAVPQVVLGGAGLVMFGMVAATGARILTGVNFKTNPYNLFVVAVSVGFGMIPLVAPAFFHNLPHELQPLLEFGILLSAVVSVILNVFFNGVGSVEAARHEAAVDRRGGGTCLIITAREHQAAWHFCTRPTARTMSASCGSIANPIGMRCGN